MTDLYRQRLDALSSMDALPRSDLWTNLPEGVSFIERHSELGPGRFWFVRLSDGHLLDCGTDPDRAMALSAVLYPSPIEVKND